MNKIEEIFLEKTGLNFTTFYKKFRPKLVYYLSKMCSSQADAEEVADESITKAMDEIHKYEKDRGQFSTWLFTIARRQYIQKLKIQKSYEYIDADYDLYETLEADNKNYFLVDVNMYKQVDIIKQQISNLPDKYSYIMELREVDGCSYSEISELTNINLNTVRSRILAGRKLLKNLVKDEFQKLDLNTFWDINNYV